MRSLLFVSLPAAALFSLAGCVAPSAPAPEPAAPIPVPAPAPAPAPAPPSSADWRDWPVTPGNWTYRQDERGSIALYGRTGADADLTLRCDRARGRLILSRRAAAPIAGQGALTLRTTSIARTVTLQPAGDATLAAELGPRDTLIDALGHSRGRFVAEGAGQPMLVLPAWPEILRVAEDCRG